MTDPNIAHSGTSAGWPIERIVPALAAGVTATGLTLGELHAPRWRLLSAFAAANLARETSLLALAGLAERPFFSRKNILRALLVAAPLAAWLVYIRWRLGPTTAGWGNFTLPGAGLIEKWAAATSAVFTVADHALAWTTFLEIGRAHV